jgi:hypothetical protein
VEISSEEEKKNCCVRRIHNCFVNYMIVILNVHKAKGDRSVGCAAEARMKSGQQNSYVLPQLFVVPHIPRISCLENHELCLPSTALQIRHNYLHTCKAMPIAVAARSKARTVFARSNTAIVGSNPAEARMFVCVLCAFFLFLHSLK